MHEPYKICAFSAKNMTEAYICSFVIGGGICRFEFSGIAVYLNQEGSNPKNMKHLLSIITNKYLLILLTSGIWMLFFDRYNLVSQIKMERRVEQLKSDEAHYRTRIDALDYERERLFNDGEELERFARERYQMKRPNEDVFIIVKE